MSPGPRNNRPSSSQHVNVLTQMIGRRSVLACGTSRRAGLNAVIGVGAEGLVVRPTIGSRRVARLVTAAAVCDSRCNATAIGQMDVARSYCSAWCRSAKAQRAELIATKQRNGQIVMWFDDHSQRAAKRAPPPARTPIAGVNGLAPVTYGCPDGPRHGDRPSWMLILHHMHMATPRHP